MDGGDSRDTEREKERTGTRGEGKTLWTQVSQGHVEGGGRPTR